MRCGTKSHNSNKLYFKKICLLQKTAREQYYVRRLDSLKGTVPPKNDQIKKKMFLLVLKYQHVSDVVVEICSCAMCLKGV